MQVNFINKHYYYFVRWVVPFSNKIQCINVIYFSDLYVWSKLMVAEAI